MQASYKIQWKKSAVKELKRLNKKIIKKILINIEDLRNNPFPSHSRKLVNSEHTYRLRIGDYRIIYSIQKGVLVIEIIRVRHRKDAYR